MRNVKEIKQILIKLWNDDFAIQKTIKCRFGKYTLSMESAYRILQVAWIREFDIRAINVELKKDGFCLLNAGHCLIFDKLDRYDKFRSPKNQVLSRAKNTANSTAQALHSVYSKKPKDKGKWFIIQKDDFDFVGCLSKLQPTQDQLYCEYELHLFDLVDLVAIVSDATIQSFRRAPDKNVQTAIGD